MVDGQFAARIGEGLKLDCGGVNFWVRWAVEMASYKDTSDFNREVFTDIAAHLFNSKIVVNLALEAELNYRYYEIVYAFHARCAENCPDRAGFRLMEYHRLLIDFIIPFWKNAKTNPCDAFPDTWKMIKELDEKDREKKFDQLTAAVEAVHDRVAKLYERWLKAPLVFLLLTHPDYGSSVLRAAKKVVDDVIQERDGDDGENDDDGDEDRNELRFTFDEPHYEGKSKQKSLFGWVEAV